MYLFFQFVILNQKGFNTFSAFIEENKQFLGLSQRLIIRASNKSSDCLLFACLAP